MKLPKSVFIHTRRWFDKTYGNTYFASLIEVGTGNYYAVPFQYGYGDQDLYEAVKVLRANGWNVSDRDLRTTGAPFDHYRVAYETTKRECKQLVEGVF